MRKNGVLAVSLSLMMVFLVGPTLAAADNTITIGFTVSRTGPLNVDALVQLHGFELWRDDVNASGGIKVGDKKYKVSFTTYDDESVARRVQQLYTRLIQNDKVQFLFSPYASSMVAPATPIAEQYGKIMIVVGSSEPKLYKLGNKHLFQIYTPSDFYATDSLAALKAKAPHAKVALAFLDSSFPQTVADAARIEAKKNGLEIVLDEKFSPHQTDFSAIINKIIASKADALLGGGFYPDSSALARQIYERKAPLKWITLLIAPDSKRFASLGAAAVGVSVPSQWSPAVRYKPEIGPTPQAFAKKFEAKYHPETPGYHGSGAYAAGLVLQHAIEKAGSIDPDKVLAELNKTDITTLFGRIKFSTDPKSHGLQVAHKLVLLQWQMKDGHLVNETIRPGDYATAPAQYQLR